MLLRCPSCGSKALGIPWLFFFEDSIETSCSACTRRFSTTLCGASNTARRYLMAFAATTLGISLFILVGELHIWVGALVAVLAVDAGWKLYLHSRSIRRSAKANDRVLH
jgi:hypothetical protein